MPTRPYRDRRVRLVFSLGVPKIVLQTITPQCLETMGENMFRFFDAWSRALTITDARNTAVVSIHLNLVVVMILRAHVRELRAAPASVIQVCFGTSLSSSVRLPPGLSSFILGYVYITLRLKMTSLATKLRTSTFFLWCGKRSFSTD